MGMEVRSVMEEDTARFEGDWLGWWWTRWENVFQMSLNLKKKSEFQQKYQPVQKYIYRVWPKIENWSLIETAKKWNRSLRAISKQ